MQCVLTELFTHFTLLHTEYMYICITMLLYNIVITMRPSFPSAAMLTSGYSRSVLVCGLTGSDSVHTLLLLVLLVRAERQLHYKALWYFTVDILHMKNVPSSRNIALFTYHCISWDRVSCPPTHVRMSYMCRWTSGLYNSSYSGMSSFVASTLCLFCIQCSKLFTFLFLHCTLITCCISLGLILFPITITHCSRLQDCSSVGTGETHVFNTTEDIVVQRATT